MQDTSFVYLIQDESGRVKIGSTGNLRRRLQQLQCCQPERLKVLATCHGGRAFELLLHERFAPYRLKGEWFDLRCSDTCDLADSLQRELLAKASYPDVDWGEVPDYPIYELQMAIYFKLGPDALTGIEPLMEELHSTMPDALPIMLWAIEHSSSMEGAAGLVRAFGNAWWSSREHCSGGGHVAVV